MICLKSRCFSNTRGLKFIYKLESLDNQTKSRIGIALEII